MSVINKLKKKKETSIQIEEINIQEVSEVVPDVKITPEKAIKLPEGITVDTRTKHASNRFIKGLMKLVLRISVYVLVVLIVLQFILAITIVHNTDSYPTVRDGDLVIANRLTGVYTGDLVLYEANGKTRIARICGVGGDVIDIPEDNIYYTVNGTIPYEVIYTDTKRAEASDVQYPFVVPEGTYFILNDNRDETSDSRQFGVLPKENIIGKVVLTVRRRGF